MKKRPTASLLGVMLFMLSVLSALSVLFVLSSSFAEAVSVNTPLRGCSFESNRDSKATYNLTSLAHPLINVNLTDAASSVYMLEQTFPRSFMFIYEGDYITKNSSDGMTVTYYILNPSKSVVSYSLAIPESYLVANGRTTSFNSKLHYMSGSSPALGSSSFTVGQYTCGNRSSEDYDGDSFGSGCGCRAEDCDDTDSAINPGAQEICDNEKDDNCNGRIDETPCLACLGVTPASFISDWLHKLYTAIINVLTKWDWTIEDVDNDIVLRCIAANKTGGISR